MDKKMINALMTIRIGRKTEKEKETHGKRSARTAKKVIAQLENLTAGDNTILLVR
jgi:hypothetical protein